MSQPMFDFRGLIVPVFTPFNNDRKTLNVALIPQYAEYLAGKGIKGILVNGTVGEGPSLSLTERKLITEAWANATKKNKMHLMVQIGGAPLPDVLELAKHAESIKVDSILCLPELYFKPSTPDELMDYLQMIGATAPKTPLLYYHVPMLSNVNINMGKFLQSIGNKIPSLVGIKFTSNDLDEGIQAMNADNGRFAIFLGSDLIMAAGCALGMNNLIATSSNIFPKLVMNIMKAVNDGNMTLARETQNKLSKAMSMISSYGNLINTMKSVMSSMTPINVGPTRPPLTGLSPTTTESLTANVRKLINEGGYE